ncbi:MULTISPECIES: M23 family metallopeptidase [Aneurinibacillus]|uniref:M23 family metallopeptidase n=1 Tax=Aneurinibacillus TaxID=55079 RepID=UPI00070E1631|nr:MULTISPECIES: M23 family metallopeptidase [Aneurinibacillus]AMA71972.1 peptidase M23 [Aneurinibacillus sp. XH2]MED0679248.1 M23 family metallopeptidase [Aneurinibacillus thermoaerophilus]MED0737134.1 M23 family metallopeptidase [Aneurinibacillus thermoaerophilus]MED0764813.1 M23 family metallopeptidase [Aneurinibacillus thermoaerophilus]
MWCKRAFLLIIVCILCLIPAPVWAASHGSAEAEARERQLLFEHMQAITGVPWYYLAAVDQYERSIHKHVKKKEKNVSPEAKQRKLGIVFSPEIWSGFLNPNPEDTSPSTISFFGGLGKDGDGDGKADRNNDLDVAYTMASYLTEFGFTEDDIRIALWQYYTRDKNVEIISNLATIYQYYNTLHLTGSAFPVPLHYNYSYRSTWGDPRGWGGRRIHEGTDIFAGYGTPVRATKHGIIETMGWNPYGGWRIGIRDVDALYHYYAHLNGFNKKFKVGDVVKPGDVIGYVGSSGYGKPGTSGKFPPHLHYGVYRDNGKTEYSYDPYPMLKRWEKEEYKNKKKKKK